MNIIELDPKIIDICNREIFDGYHRVARKLHKRFGDSLAVPVYLHIFLCRVMDSAFCSAPDNKEAERFILSALQEVKEFFKDREN